MKPDYDDNPVTFMDSAMRIPPKSKPVCRIAWIILWFIFAIEVVAIIAGLARLDYKTGYIKRTINEVEEGDGSYLSQLRPCASYALHRTWRVSRLGEDGMSSLPDVWFVVRQLCNGRTVVERNRGPYADNQTDA